MQIEEITKDDIDEIASSVKDQLRDLADKKHEEALIRDLKASQKTAKEKLREYLTHTRLRPRLSRTFDYWKGVENQYVEKQLRIHRHTLKKVREELEAEGLITTFTDVEGILRIRPQTW